MTACLGGIFVCMGATKILDLITLGNEIIRRNVQRAPNESRCQQITRVVANVLLFIGMAALALTAFSIGSHLIVAGAQFGFLLAFDGAMQIALPKLIIAIGALAASEIANRLAS